MNTFDWVVVGVTAVLAVLWIIWKWFVGGDNWR